MKTKKKAEKVEKEEKNTKKTENKILKYIKGKKHNIIQRIHNMKRTEDYQALKEIVAEVLIYGLTLGPVISYILQTNILTTMLYVGLFVFVFEKKILYMICQLFGSIKLVQINR